MQTDFFFLVACRENWEFSEITSTAPDVIVLMDSGLCGESILLLAVLDFRAPWLENKIEI
jgi:hypothetical protein